MRAGWVTAIGRIRICNSVALIGRLFYAKFECLSTFGRNVNREVRRVSGISSGGYRPPVLVFLILAFPSTF